MTEQKIPISLLEAIAFWFEKNELPDGWGHRYVPMPSEEVARRTFSEWMTELNKWQGSALVERHGDGQRVEWPAIRLKQQGRGVGIYIHPGKVWDLWHEKGIWDGDPCDHVYAWEWDDEAGEC